MCSGTPTLRRCAALRIIRRRGPPIHGRGPSAGRSGWLVSEPSPAAQDEDHFAAAAPRETLPGPGLAIAGDLETATRALDAPAKLQQILAYLPLRTTALHPRRLRRRRGGTGGTVTLSRAATSSRVSFSLGLDRPSSEFLLVMFPPGLSFP